MDYRQKYLREEYTARVNRVIDYIQANIDAALSLEELAGIAHFSPFHFHRIFRAMTGETISGFIQRIRLEKAAATLILNPRKSVTGVALECGFSNSSAFARAFKDAFGISATQWRTDKLSSGSKIGTMSGKYSQMPGNPGQEFVIYPAYTEETKQQIWRIEMKDTELKANVVIKDMPEMHVAYVRHIGPYKGDEGLFAMLITKLMTWAGPRGLLGPDTRLMSLYYDDPDITDKDKLRTDVSITVPPDTKVDGEIGKTIIPAGKYAAARFEIPADRYQDAWNAVYAGWLPESGYQPASGPCYELYLNDPKTHPEGKNIVEICLPVCIKAT